VSLARHPSAFLCTRLVAVTRNVCLSWDSTRCPRRVCRVCSPCAHYANGARRRRPRCGAWRSAPPSARAATLRTTPTCITRRIHESPSPPRPWCPRCARSARPRPPPCTTKPAARCCVTCARGACDTALSRRRARETCCCGISLLAKQSLSTEWTFRPRASPRIAVGNRPRQEPGSRSSPSQLRWEIAKASGL
jgi:hypothetical protein